MNRKECFRHSCIDSELCSIQFGVLSQNDILNNSVVPVTKGKSENILSDNAVCDPKMVRVYNSLFLF